MTGDFFAIVLRIKTSSIEQKWRQICKLKFLLEAIDSRIF